MSNLKMENDIVILETRQGKDKGNKDDSRRSGIGANESRNDKNKGGGGGRDNRDRGKNSRSSHRDRGSDRPHDHRNSHGGSTSNLNGSRNAPNTKFSGMAFTEAELLSEIPKKKFTGRCRLFVGNLPNEVKDSELKELFTPHGDISECYMSGKGFAFLRLDTRAHAESAKEALDGKAVHGRQIRVRFAVHGATIKVKELAPIVSNEMLHLTFSAFGEVERAVHIVDEKGKPTGEGIIEFERKSSAVDAIAQIKERVFLMTSNSRPLSAELVEPRDEEDGLSERMLQRTAQLLKERELGPRFATLNSFEFVYGQRWKEIYEIERKRHAELDLELKEARKRLESDMEIAYEDYKTQLLREGLLYFLMPFAVEVFWYLDLQRRQQELERLEAAKRERLRHVGVHSGGNFFGGGSGNSGPSNDPPLRDGPLGRNPPTFGVGSRSGPMFFGGGPGNNNNVPPPSVGRPDVSKIADVQKLLQTLNNDGVQRNFGQDFIIKNMLNNRQPNQPNFFSHLPEPITNAFANGPAGGPSGLGGQPRGIPPPPGAFQPPEKRMRR